MRKTNSIKIRFRNPFFRNMNITLANSHQSSEPANPSLSFIIIIVINPEGTCTQGHRGVHRFQSVVTVRAAGMQHGFGSRTGPGAQIPKQSIKSYIRVLMKPFSCLYKNTEL